MKNILIKYIYKVDNIIFQSQIFIYLILVKLMIGDPSIEIIQKWESKRY